MTSAFVAPYYRHSRPLNVCRSCAFRLRKSSRLYATTAAEPARLEPSEPSSSEEATSALVSSESHSSRYKIDTAVLLSRPPLLTRDLTPFEKAFFLYQRRLNERLALPFTRYFYYQKGTLGDVEWKRKMRERRTPARDIGRYTAYSTESWNDELLVGDDLSEPHTQIDALVRDAEDTESGGGPGRKGDETVDRPLSRLTQADKENNTRSLNRALSRTLYLVMQYKEQGDSSATWTLPRTELRSDESLQRAASRTIVQAAGRDMNTWVVGNMPVGHRVYNYPKPSVKPDSPQELHGEKVFYMKARMMAGNVQLDGSHIGYTDFQWLKMEEIQNLFQPQDFSGFKNLLSKR